MAPYIGITGFMTQAEVRAVLDVIPHDASHQLMVGVLASWKTIRGLGNKYPSRYPTMQNIGSIFVNDPRVVNLVHYATDDISTLDEQLENLERHVCQPHDGYQLNLCWPKPAILAKSLLPGLRRVLQVGRPALELVGYAPAALALEMYSYDGLITDILIDPSAGKGFAFDPVQASELLLAVRERHPKIGLGVAGGLSAKTLNLVEPLVRLIPDLSIDAEGRLRNPADDNLDLKQACEYVSAAFELFRQG
ncbi:hypothetical protein HZC53_04245 [Candidatus Uhrbacteria bacterium]|nr:hypothetical protein [Candidatus Uhrbacteria bacterium]